MTRGRLTLNQQTGHLDRSVQRDRIYKKRGRPTTPSTPSTPEYELPVVVSVRSIPPPTPNTLKTFTIESFLDAACAGEALGQLDERINGSSPCLASDAAEAGRSQDYTNPAYEPDDSKNKELDQSKRSWSMVLRQVIDQQDDDDLHPYGRGGIYHNIIYGRNVKVQYDYNKMVIWIMLIGCLVLGAGAIIFASEMSIHYKHSAVTDVNTTLVEDYDNATTTSTDGS